MVTKQASQKEGCNKIATFAAKYSNKSTGLNYKGSIERFLRSVYNVPKGTPTNYEQLFDQYLQDSKRNRSADIKQYSDVLVRECVSKQSARQILTYAVKVLKSYGITINECDIGDIKRECKGGAATVDKVLTHDVICKTLRSSDVQMRALILVLASSGIRIGEALSLTISDIDMSMTPAMINIRADNSKNGYARFSFISQEAREALNDYMSKRSQFIESAESQIQKLAASGKIATVNKESDLLFPITDSTVNKKWETLLKKAGVFSRDAKSNRNQYRIHSLRKFFVSQISMAGSKTLAEHLAGHTGYLDQSYRQVSPEFAAREYLKIQSVLTCCIPESIKAGIKMADEKISILMEKTEMQSTGYEGLKIQNEQLRQRLNDMESKLSRILEFIDNSSAAPAPGASVPLSTVHSKITHQE